MCAQLCSKFKLNSPPPLKKKGSMHPWCSPNVFCKTYNAGIPKDTQMYCKLGVQGPTTLIELCTLHSHWDFILFPSQLLLSLCPSIFKYLEMSLTSMLADNYCTCLHGFIRCLCFPILSIQPVLILFNSPSQLIKYSLSNSHSLTLQTYWLNYPNVPTGNWDAKDINFQLAMKEVLVLSEAWNVPLHSKPQNCWLDKGAGTKLCLFPPLHHPPPLKHNSPS